MTTTTTTDRPLAVRPVRSGLALAVSSAAAFGLSGSLARSLFDLGWSPAAVVTARIGGAFAALLIPCLLVLRRTGLPRGRQLARLTAYGVVAVGLAQLCYFSAVQYLPVGVALLLEYLAPVMLIGLRWARSRRRPAGPVLAGAALSLAGLALVLDLPQVFGGQGGGAIVHPVGVLWGLGAAVCLCGYFLLSDESAAQQPLHPLLLAAGGTGIGTLTLLAAAAAGVVDLTARTGQTTLAGTAVDWWWPIALLVLVSAVFAYLTGIAGVRALGSAVASFVSLTEVLFAVGFAALLLAQRPGAIQLVGGVLILAGIALVQRPPRSPRSTLAR